MVFFMSKRKVFVLSCLTLSSVALALPQPALAGGGIRTYVTSYADGWDEWIEFGTTNGVAPTAVMNAQLIDSCLSLDDPEEDSGEGANGTEFDFTFVIEAELCPFADAGAADVGDQIAQFGWLAFENSIPRTFSCLDVEGTVTSTGDPEGEITFGQSIANGVSAQVNGSSSEQFLNTFQIFFNLEIPGGLTDGEWTVSMSIEECDGRVPFFDFKLPTVETELPDTL